MGWAEHKLQYARGRAAPAPTTSHKTDMHTRGGLRRAGPHGWVTYITRQASGTTMLQQRPERITQHAGRARRPDPPLQRRGPGPGPAGTADTAAIHILSPGSCTHTLRCQARRHAPHSPYSPGSDRYTPDRFLPGRRSSATISSDRCIS